MIWSQHWSDVMSLHFAVPPTQLMPHLPRHLELDLFDGRAWISFVLFQLRLRPAWLPFIPGFSSLIELNIRTYVRHRGSTGIYFLSMHADNALAIHAARLLTPLHYQAAHFTDTTTSSGRRRIECQSASDARHRLAAEFRPAGPPVTAAPGSMDAWLLERYRLFVGVKDALIAADVEHPPWEFQPLQVHVAESTIAEPLGIALGPAADAGHHSSGVTARFGAFRPALSSPDLNRVPAGLPDRAIAPHAGR
jgi:uncharacterized protein YqjF (DUF2071 family)